MFQSTHPTRGGTLRKGVIPCVFALAIVCAGMGSMRLRGETDTNAVTEPQFSTVCVQRETSEDQSVSPTPDIEVIEADWRLILVNRWNPLPDDYDITLTQLMNGQAVDERCYPDLQEMMDDCRAAGLNPLICSSYRTQAYQGVLFQNKVDRLIAQGYSEADARTEAGKEVAVPGTSEHQLGLAVDIVDSSNQLLDESQENTPVQQWLIENSWQYGFILRYPSDKSDITGIIYEPWHYRYVGKEAAKEIYEQGICLEEYIAYASFQSTHPARGGTLKNNSAA